MIASTGLVKIVILILAVIVGFGFVKRGYTRGAMGEIRSLLGIAVAVVCIILILIIRQAVAEQTYSTVIVVLGAIVVISIGWKFTRMILELLSGITELPIIGFADSLLGAVMGGAECIGIIWIVYRLYSVFL